MQVHEIKSKEPDLRNISVDSDHNVPIRTYRCLREGLEYAGYVLRKGDQITGSKPVCGRGSDLTVSNEIRDKKGKIISIHPPCFELVGKMVEVQEPASTFEKTDDDPRSKKQICADIFQNFEEKVNPLRIGRPELLVLEQKYIIERGKDGLTAQTDYEVIK